MCIIITHTTHIYSIPFHILYGNNIHPIYMGNMDDGAVVVLVLYYLWTFSTDKCASAVAEKIYINFHCVLKYMILHQIVLCCFVLGVVYYTIYTSRLYVYNNNKKSFFFYSIIRFIHRFVMYIIYG